MANYANDREVVGRCPTIDGGMDEGVGFSQFDFDLLLRRIGETQCPVSDRVRRFRDRVCECSVGLEQSVEIGRLNNVEWDTADEGKIDQLSFEDGRIGACVEQETINCRLAWGNGSETETAVGFEPMAVFQMLLDMASGGESVPFYYVPLAQAATPLDDPVFGDLITNMPDPRRLSSTIAILFADAEGDASSWGSSWDRKRHQDELRFF